MGWIIAIVALSFAMTVLVVAELRKPVSANTIELPAVTVARSRHRFVCAWHVLASDRERANHGRGQRAAVALIRIPGHNGRCNGHWGCACRP
jgi:hypothetical protein